MKQNITIEQVKELSPSMLNKLIVFMDMGKYYLGAKMHIVVYEDTVLEAIAQYCTVGKMIEALHNNYIEFTLDNRSGGNESFYLSRRIDEISWYGKTGKEPCNLLWLAIKEVLKSL